VKNHTRKFTGDPPGENIFAAGYIYGGMFTRVIIHTKRHLWGGRDRKHRGVLIHPQERGDPLSSKKKDQDRRAREYTYTPWRGDS